MDYFCTHYWQKDSGMVSLVLKHLVYQRDYPAIVFAVLAEGRLGEQFVEGMTGWFYQKGIYEWAKNNTAAELLERELERLWRTSKEGLQGGAVLLCRGKYFFAWNRGNTKVCLLNNRFGRNQCRSLLGKQEEGCIGGILESGVGLLLTTDNFRDGISRELLAKCLTMNTTISQKAAEKKLQELGNKMEKEGGTHLAAMLIVACQKKEEN